jgi:hypothetical protein
VRFDTEQARDLTRTKTAAVATEEGMDPRLELGKRSLRNSFFGSAHSITGAYK